MFRYKTYRAEFGHSDFEIRGAAERLVSHIIKECETAASRGEGVGGTVNGVDMTVAPERRRALVTYTADAMKALCSDSWL